MACMMFESGGDRPPFPTGRPIGKRGESAGLTIRAETGDRIGTLKPSFAVEIGSDFVFTPVRVFKEDVSERLRFTSNSRSSFAGLLEGHGLDGIRVYDQAAFAIKGSKEASNEDGQAGSGAFWFVW